MKSSKFLFDVEFDSKGGQVIDRTSVDLAQHQQDVLIAEAQGYERGIIDGRQTQEARAADALMQMARSVVDAAAQVQIQLEKERQQLMAEAIELSMTLMKTLLPAMVKQGGIQDIDHLVRTCLENLRGAPHLVVHVHDTFIDDVQKSVERAAREKAFEGKLIVLGNPDVALGNCRVEWADGGMIFNRDEALRSIEQAVERFISSRVRN